MLKYLRRVSAGGFTNGDLYMKNSICLAITVHYCTPDDALVVRNILSSLYTNPFQFVKPPSDTLLRY
jgi:hypothetical protein